MFNFNEKFKTSGTIDLLRMLEHPDKYQPDAITAAKLILEDRRKVHPEEWQNAVEKLKAEKNLFAVNKVDTSDISSVAEDVQDIWIEDEVSLKNQKLAWNQVLVICGVFSVIVLRSLYYTVIWLWGADDIIEESVRGAFGIGTLVLMIMSVVFLLKKEKIGWVLLVAKCSLEAFSFLFVIAAFFYNSYNTNNFRFPYTFYNFVLPQLIYLVILRRALSKPIMKLFKVNFKWFWVILVTVIFLFVCYAVGLARRGY